MSEACVLLFTQEQSLRFCVRAPSILVCSRWNEPLMLISHGFPRFCDLGAYLPNHLLEHRFAFLQRMCVDIPGMLLTVRPDGRVSALPEVLVDLTDTAGSRSAPLCFDRGELLTADYFFDLRFGSVCFCDSLVDFHGGAFLHLSGDMRVDIQRCAGGCMPYDGGQGFEIHAMFQ